MHIAWIQAAIYDPPEVLGQKLKLLSPYHVLMLDSIQSPFMVGGKYDLHDMVLAVHVCSTSWADRYSVFSTPAALKRWGRKQGKCDWKIEAETFKLYLSESWTIPESWQGAGGGKAKANGAYHLAVFAMRRLRMTEAEAWDCPVARLCCYRDTFDEQETGKSELITDNERKGIEVLKGDDGR